MLWSHKQEDKLKDIYPDKYISWDKMESMFGVSKKAICHKASRLGLNRGKTYNRSCKPRKIWDKEYYSKNKDRIYNNKKRRIKKLKELLVEMLGGKCNRCGFVGEVVVYDFHHIEEKKEALSLLIQINKKKAITEAKKCEIGRAHV